LTDPLTSGLPGVGRFDYEHV